MMLAEAARPARQSAPFMEPSTVSCEAVAACTVVMRPCLIPNFSLIVLTRGARPLVVHEAHETTCIDGSYSSVLTPTTMVGVSASLAGAEMITFFAPAASMCTMHFSVSVKAPVDSQTYSTPVAFHGISAGSRTPERVTLRPLMMSELPSSPISHEPLKRPCTVSYSSRYLRYSGARAPLMCFSTIESRSMAMRTTWRPMRPKPLTPTLIGAEGLVDMPIEETARESAMGAMRRGSEDDL